MRLMSSGVCSKHAGEYPAGERGPYTEPLPCPFCLEARIRALELREAPTTRGRSSGSMQAITPEAEAAFRAATDKLPK